MRHGHTESLSSTEKQRMYKINYTYIAKYQQKSTLTQGTHTHTHKKCLRT